MRKMKDSGIEWIGQIPKGWELRRAKTLFTQRNSKGNGIEVLLSPTQKYGVVPQSQLEGVVQVKEDTDLQMFKTVHKGDFVISLRSFQGGFEYSLYEGVCSPAYQVFYPTSPICDTYYRYLFKSQSFISKMNNLTVGIREGKNIQYVDFANSQIPVPPLAEQERIAVFLDAECAEIDTALEKARASIEEYKKLKQAVITQAVTKGIFDKQIYPHNVKLKYLLYIASGDAIRNEELSEVGKYPAYGGGESLGFASKYNTLENSLIVGRVGARCGCVTYIDSKAWATDNALIVHPICNPRYMYYMLIYSQLNNLNTSNAQPLITATKIKNVVVPYFLEDICQKKIVDFLDEKCACIDAIIEKKQQYLTEIENYKKSLIYEYVTGKKEVKTSVLAD